MYASGITTAAPHRTKHDYAITSVTPYGFSNGSTRMDDPSSAEFFRSAMPASGVAVSESRLTGVQGTSFRDMATAVMAHRPPESGAELVIIAHSSPDLVPNDIPAIALFALQRPAASAAFALCDEGSLIAFTAIDTARQFAARHDYARVLILLADNATFPYEPATTDVQAVARDAAVLLVVEPCNSRSTSVDRRSIEPGTGGSGVEALLLAMIAEARAGGPQSATDTVWTLGYGLREFAAAARTLTGGAVVVVATPGQPVTTVWQLAVETAAISGQQSAVVIDLDMGAGAIVACRFNLDAGSHT